jgi:hypothetical protein
MTAFDASRPRNVPAPDIVFSASSVNTESALTKFLSCTPS